MLLKITPKVVISLCDKWTPLSCPLHRCSQHSPGYSDVQAKVRDATSNDPWGPSGTQMNEIAQLTYNQSVTRLIPSVHRLAQMHLGMTSWRSWKCWISDSTTRARTGGTSSRLASCPARSSPGALITTPVGAHTARLLSSCWL